MLPGTAIFGFSRRSMSLLHKPLSGFFEKLLWEFLVKSPFRNGWAYQASDSLELDTENSGLLPQIFYSRALFCFFCSLLGCVRDSSKLFYRKSRVIYLTLNDSTSELVFCPAAVSEKNVLVRNVLFLSVTISIFCNVAMKLELQMCLSQCVSF